MIHISDIPQLKDRKKTANNDHIVIGTRVTRPFARGLRILAAKEDKSPCELIRTEQERIVNERG
jgi:hypothetical protein